MLWLIFALLLSVGVTGFLAPSTLLGGIFQILLISALVALAVHRVRAVSSRIRRYQLD